MRMLLSITMARQDLTLSEKFY